MDISSGKKLSLRLDGDLVERLEDYASRERVPVSWVLRHLVLRFLSSPDKDDKPARSALPRVAAPDAITREQNDFRDRCCALFDGFRAQGLDARESAKRTNFALKEKRHPWATYEVVADVLRKEGRFRKVRLKRG